MPVKVSVVIPALNEEAFLGGLLSDLAAQSRPADEVFVVDAGSGDGTVSVARRFPFVTLLEGHPPVAEGRNLGGFSATGEVVVFLDADVRLEEGFLEGLLEEFEGLGLDVACPRYFPQGGSTPTIRALHAFFNALFLVSQHALPSGAGHCIIVQGEVFRESRGFDPGLKFDDIELVRRLSRGRSFGIVGETVYVSDRRYRKYGVARTFSRHLLMGVFFALGKFEWANHVDYEFGKHEVKQSQSKEKQMTTTRVIPTQVHAVLDYLTGGALVAAPRLLGLSGTTAGQVLNLAGGIATAQSLMTDYELGLVRVIPMRAHLTLDAASGAMVAASPWLFGFAGNGRKYWLPHVIVGATEILAAATTKTR